MPMGILMCETYARVTQEAGRRQSRALRQTICSSSSLVETCIWDPSGYRKLFHRTYHGQSRDDWSAGATLTGV